MAIRDNKIFIPNEIYFITFTILDWQHVFISDLYCNLVIQWFEYIKIKYNNKIHGYVIMPSHVHVLIKITDQSPVLSKLIQNAKRFIAYGIVKQLTKENNQALLAHFNRKAEKNKKAKHKIFQPRYASLIIQSEKLFL